MTYSIPPSPLPSQSRVSAEVATAAAAAATSAKRKGDFMSLFETAPAKKVRGKGKGGSSSSESESEPEDAKEVKGKPSVPEALGHFLDSGPGPAAGSSAGGGGGRGAGGSRSVPAASTVVRSSDSAESGGHVGSTDGAWGRCGHVGGGVCVGVGGLCGRCPCARWCVVRCAMAWLVFGVGSALLACFTPIGPDVGATAAVPVSVFAWWWPSFRHLRCGLKAHRQPPLLHSPPCPKPHPPPLWPAAGSGAGAPNMRMPPPFVPGEWLPLCACVCTWCVHVCARGVCMCVHVVGTGVQCVPSRVFARPAPSHLALCKPH